MKKIIILLFCLLLITGCSTKDDVNQIEKYYSGTTLDDGRVIHFSLNIEYNGKWLGDVLLTNELKYEDFLKKLEHLVTARDGGSAIYKYNKKNKIFGIKDFYVYSCNKLNENKETFISVNKRDLEYYCIKKIDDLKDVNMKIKENTVSKTGLTVIISDNSNRDNIYGDDYKLEIKKNNKWEDLELKKELVFNSIGYSISKGESKEFKINWEYPYGKLKPGDYRILKTTSVSGEGIVHYLTAEFIIK